MAAGKTVPKGLYYKLRYQYMRMSKQYGHRLSLAITKEEDEYWWQRYKNVLDQWHLLKKPEGVCHHDDIQLRCTCFMRPTFNDKYVELTERLKEAYIRRNATSSKQQRHIIDEEIYSIKQQRYMVTTYYNRETGDEVKPRCQLIG